MWQLWAMCTYASNRLSLPIVVSEPSPVPRWIVTNSRMTLRSPMRTLDGSPRYFLSCDVAPTTVKGWISHCLPIDVLLLTTTFASRRVPSPSLTCSPTRQNGPTSTPRPSSALGCTIAVAWMLRECEVRESRFVTACSHVENRGVEAEQPCVRHHRE